MQTDLHFLLMKRAFLRTSKYTAVTIKLMVATVTEPEDPNQVDHI